MPLRTHLESVHRQTGRMPKALADAPKLPRGCAALWGDFLELHNSRSFGPGGPLRISFLDLDAYQRVRGFGLEAWEIAAIRAADAAFLGFKAEQRK